ncbi:NAD(P)-binding domain-containing protein [Streptomyces sp. NPDC049040]|uniref:NAD(P)-binding domain-containing protein n=1 Tax=Streptomyces sp. NPDC049040 TaxID=3365593 RepID=UPI00371AB225
MTTVGLIGSGAIGSTIARFAVEAGHQVVLSNSRGPGTLADTVARLGPGCAVRKLVAAGQAAYPYSLITPPSSRVRRSR